MHVVQLQQGDKPLSVNVQEEQDSLQTFQNTASINASSSGAAASPSNQQYNTVASPSNQQYTTAASPTNYGSPTAHMRQSNLSSNLFAQTGGLIPISGYAEHKVSKGGAAGSPCGKSQLNKNMVPNDDALSSFIEAGQVYGLKHTDKDTESHVDSNLVPLAEFDAGIGFEGWFTNGQNNYIKPNHQSHIDPHNGAPLDDAETWQEGWCGGRGGSQFALPVRNQRRASGLQRASTEPANIRPPVFSKDDVEFRAPARARAVARRSPKGEYLPEDQQWTTSYDVNFAPMNERRNERVPMARRKTGPKKKVYKSQRTFNWRKRAAEKKAGLMRSPQGKAPWAGGAKKVEIPQVVSY
jgi:hypothetical protein